jgi:hypothetical protein
MEDKQGQIPMYIDGGNHQAFIRYELSTWPDTHHIWMVYCPGCAQMARSACETYQTAYEIALEHRVDEEAWIPAKTAVWGPVAKWGPAQ